MFQLFADKNKLSLLRREPLTSGSVNVYPVRFEFSKDWEGLTRTAVFRGGGESRSVLLDETGACFVPWEVLRKPCCMLEAGVYGTRGSDTVLPTMWAGLGAIFPGAAPGGEAQPPTPDLWEQALAKKGDALRYDGECLSLLNGEAVLSTVRIAGGYDLAITFGPDLKGLPYMVTGPDGVRSGTVPDTLRACVPVRMENAAYTVSASAGGISYSASVTTGQYYGRYPVELSARPKIYGIQWDGSGTTKWTRTDDAADLADPVPYVAGADSYGSPFDSVQPWAGMVKEERSGGTMVAIPKFWYKLTQSGGGLKIQISGKAVEGFSVSPAHMDRGDGKGERDTVYIGRYHCGSGFKSASGQIPKGRTTRAEFRAEIRKLGDGVWQSDFAMRFTLWLLYLVEFADWDSQKAIGRGCGNNSSVQAMGYTDSMPYHTGTTRDSRDAYGLGTQYRNIEGLWDNVLDWEDGCYNSGSGLMVILNPSDYSDTDGGVSAGVPVSGYPTAFTVSDQAGFAMFLPAEAKGSTAEASCDGWDFSAAAPAVYVGGSLSQDDSYGLFYRHYTSVSNSNPSIGSRLQELP